jgi:general secretion pathway protein F
MTRQLASLLKANIPLVDCLQAVAEQTENTHLAEIIADIRGQVNEGGAFHKALAKYPHVFDKIYVSMCEAGEMSGTLDTILLRLAEFTEAEYQLRSQVQSAMIYPIIMIGMTVLVLVGLFLYVIPKIMGIFEACPGVVLPWYSQIVFTMSGFLIDYWVLIFSTVALAYFVFWNWKRTPAGSRSWDIISLQLPIAGKVARMVAVARFTRTLSTLLNGGVSMLVALSIVRNVVNNEIIAEAIDSARDNISEGESIAGPLKKSGQFPPLVLHMIANGEKTGELEPLLNQVSDSYDFQVKNSIQSLTAALGPVMIIVMGVVVAFIVMAILVPIMSLQDACS